MKFLIDNALTPVISEGLKEKGYDTIHVRDVDLSTANDEEIFIFAEKHNRTIHKYSFNFFSKIYNWKPT